MNPEKRILIHLLIIMVLDLLAFTCILPLFPALMDYYDRQTQKSDLYHVISMQLQLFRQWIGIPEISRFNSVLFGGLLGSLFSFLQFLSSPLLGAFSDLFGRKTLMIVSSVGSIASYLLWSQARTFEIFVLSRVVGGLSKASVSVASAIIADVLPNKSRGKGMALIGAAFSIGFIAGPMIGAYFAHRSRGAIGQFYEIPAYFACSLSFVELIWICAFLPETLPASKRVNKSVNTILKNVSTYISPKALFRFEPLVNNGSDASIRVVRKIGLIYFLYLFIYSGLEFTLTFFTHLRFDYNSMQQGQMYLLTGLLMVFVQGGYVRRIDATQQRKTALLGLCAIVPSFILIGLAYGWIMFYLGLILFAFGSATVVTCLTTMISSYGGESEQGTILGVFRSLGALARASGPVLASAVFWLVGPTACYVAGGLLLLIPYILLKNLHPIEHESKSINGSKPNGNYKSVDD